MVMVVVVVIAMEMVMVMAMAAMALVMAMAFFFCLFMLEPSTSGFSAEDRSSPKEIGSAPITFPN